MIHNLDIALLLFLSLSERNAEIQAVRVERAADQRAPAKPDGRHGTAATSGWGIGQALQGKSYVLIHAPAQIDKHPVGIAYLDKSKAQILEVNDHICSYRQDDGERDGVQHIQTMPYRHVVAREQRTRESQRASPQEGSGHDRYCVCRQCSVILRNPRWTSVVWP